MSRPVRPRTRWRSRLHYGSTVRTTRTPTCCRSLFLGTEGHGVVHVSGRRPRPTRNRATGASAWPGSRHRPPQALRRLVVEDEGLSVAGDQRRRFLDEFYPRLRRLAPVASSDGSFTPPTAPRPHARAAGRLRRQPRARAGVGVGLRRRRHAGPASRSCRPRADDHGPGSRRGARGARRTRPPAVRGRPAAGPTAPARPCCPRVGLDGLDTMRFSTEVLPCSPMRPESSSRSAARQRPTGRRATSMQVGVSTAESDEGTDWFDLGVRSASTAAMCRSRAVHRARHGRDAPAPAGRRLLLAAQPALAGPARLIEEARALQDARRPHRISRFQAGLWEELARSASSTPRPPRWQQQVAGLLATDGRRADRRCRPASAPSCGPTSTTGFDWLAFLWRHGLGGMLADDMGLGKTLQTLALICHAREAEPARRRRSSSSRRPPSCRTGRRRRRASPPGCGCVTVTDTLRRRGRRARRSRSRGADVVVTSYTLFRLDADGLRAASAWAGLVLDEAQFVKNHQTKVHQCARRLPAPFKLAITGTPMENSLMELWSLLSITAPGLFPARALPRDCTRRPIERERRRRAARPRLRRRIRPLMLRRTKELVAPELPPKQEQVLDGRARRRGTAALRRGTCSASGRRCWGCSTTSTATGSSSSARSPCCACSASHPALIDDAHADVAARQARRAARAARRRGRRGPPRAGLQPVHLLPRARRGAARRRRHRATPTSTASTRDRDAVDRSGSARRRRRSS